MIPDIQEVNFPSYATLHEATVTLVDMGERTIETQVRIDGSVAPDFSGWELRFRGERFVLPTKDPQASKDNTTINAIATLNFRSWAIEELKRYYFFTIANTESGTAIADKYEASVMMSLPEFVSLFNDVLEYYFGNKIQMDLFPMDYGTTKYLVEIKYSKLWDVLTKFYEVFGRRWYIEAGANDTYVIKVNYLSTEDDITDHVFQYGYDGGLLRFERQVQDENITNILLGRGGEKNLPYRYFKKELQEGGNTWTGDPDAIPELADIYFDRLHDAVFRWYVRGWMHNPNRDTSGDEEWDPGHVFPTYTISSSSPYYWAYQKGLTDDTFDPVEYVKDDESIAAHGEHWGALDDNDNIYPTIQNRWREGVNGRIDECVAVSEITTDDVADYSRAESTKQTLRAMLNSGPFYRNSEEAQASGWNFTPHTFHNRIISDVFTIPENKSGVLTFKWVQKNTNSWLQGLVQIDTANATLVARSVSGAYVSEFSDLGEDAPMPIPSGTYSLDLTFDILVNESGLTPQQKAYITQSGISGTFGIESIVINIVDEDADGWKPTFDIWVKNLWGTQIASGETSEQYAERVWLPILGDVHNNEASVTFTSGWMAASSDYEFKIAGIPVYDTSKTVVTKDRNGNTVTAPSHWRITLYKSDAEYEATGYYIPRVGYQPVAKDTFFFSGIDMPIYYVLLAEEELNTYKTAHLGDFSHVAPTWVVGLDKVRVHTQEQADQAGILADRLKTGILLKVSDPRFTAGQELNLYIQTLTFRWAEPSKDSPYIVPDIELVLSDKVVPYTNPVSQLQGDVSVIQSEYVRVSDVEEIVRRIAGSIYLKKTGEEEISASPTAFASRVTSPNFRQGGVGGRGWGVYRSNSPRRMPGSTDISEEDEESVIETDRLIVRKEMEVNNLVVNQVSYRGGKEIISAAKIEVVGVEEQNGTYRCYFDQKQGSVLNLFVVGDIAMCQVFSPDNELTRYYKMVVSEAGADYIDLDGATNDGSGVPQIGDVIVQFGHENLPARQYVIVRDVIGGGYEQMISGLTVVYDEETESYSYSAGKEYYFAGREGAAAARWFVGDRASGQFAEFANGIFKISGPAQIGQGGNATTIEGNLVQSGTISLGSVTGNQFTIWAGMSGVYDTTLPDPGKSIAAWYGGPKVDHEADASAPNFAKTLFRFDGSGYLAGGNIKWNPNGYGQIPGVSWDANGIIISNDVKFNIPGSQETEYLVNALNTLSGMFIRETYTEGNVTKQRIKVNPNYTGLYTEGFLTAGGINSGGGGGGGGNAAWVPNSSLWPTESANAIGLNVDGTIHTLSLRGHRHNITDIDGVLNLPLEYRDNLPAASASTMGKIYLVPSSQQETRNIKDEYITIQSGSSYVWEQIGNTAVDLTNYVQKSDITGFLKNNGSVDTNSYIPIVANKTGRIARFKSDGTVEAAEDCGNVGTPIYLDNGTPTAIKYLNIASEQSDGLILPYVFNDLAHLKKWAGTSACTVKKNNTTIAVDVDKWFDGSPSYAGFSVNKDSDTVTIEIVLPTSNNDYALSYGNKFYIDFGATNWRAKNIALQVYYVVGSSGTSETELEIPGSSVEGWDKNFWICRFNLGETNDTAQRVKRIVLTLSKFQNTAFRIYEIGVVNYNSKGAKAGYMSRGFNDPVYRSISPYNSNTYSLGDSNHKWNELYVNTINATSLSATNFTASGYIQTPVIKNSSGVDRISLSTNVTISANTLVNGSLYPAASGKHLGLSTDPWGDLYLAASDSVGIRFSKNNTSYLALNLKESASELHLGSYDTIHDGIKTFVRGSEIVFSTRNIQNTGGYDVISIAYNSTRGNFTLKPLADYASVRVDLGEPTLRWNNIYAKAWYPTTTDDTDAPHIEYVAGSTPYFKIVGNLVATGFITAGGINANTGDTTINGSLIPSGSNYDLGTSGSKFRNAFINQIGSSGAKVSELYVTTIGDNDAQSRVSSIYADSIDVNDLKNYVNIDTILTNYAPSTNGTSIASSYSTTLANFANGVLSGTTSRIKSTSTTYSEYKYPGFYQIAKVEKIYVSGTRIDVRICFGTTQRLERVNGSWKYYNNWA